MINIIDRKNITANLLVMYSPANPVANGNADTDNKNMKFKTAYFLGILLIKRNIW